MPQRWLPFSPRRLTSRAAAHQPWYQPHLSALAATALGYPPHRVPHSIQLHEPLVLHNGLFMPRILTQLFLRLPLYLAASVTAAASYTYYQLSGNAFS